MLARQHDKYEALTPVIARPGTAFLAEKGATWHASTFGDVQFAVSLSNFDTAQTSRPGVRTGDDVNASITRAKSCGGPFFLSLLPGTVASHSRNIRDSRLDRNCVGLELTLQEATDDVATRKAAR
jgi:hypothetical protein